MPIPVSSSGRSPNTIGPVDGSPQNSMDAGQVGGMSPADCAAQILAGLDRRKDEIVIGGKETRYLLLHRIFPGLFRRAIRSSRVT